MNDLMRGDVFITHRFFRHLRSLIQSSRRILNLGSGVAFGFEHFCKRVNPEAQLWSADRLPKPYEASSVTHYVQADLEADCVIAEAASFDMVCLFEVIEHLDKTDSLLRNAVRHCRTGGAIAVSFPNLASLYGRIELGLGYQPHVLEVSNEVANCGSGWFGRMNNPTNVPIHHIRGITALAARELLTHHGLVIRKAKGASHGAMDHLWQFVPQLAPVNLVICEKPARSSAEA
jgi:SAM-dependent methyltransferase